MRVLVLAAIPERDANRSAENQSRLESKREIVVALGSFGEMKETRFPQRTRNPARIAGFLRLATAMLVLAALRAVAACYHSAAREGTR